MFISIFTESFCCNVSRTNFLSYEPRLAETTASRNGEDRGSEGDEEAD
ncbi:hypothetical protein PQG02_01650 [Nostoc sp. UHCC 0926]|nr:hypothetical protein PQG02_01650 [Nostoc sp. UHCC 0926]